MPKKSKSKSKKKTNRVIRDFLLPDLQSSEDGNPIQSVAKVDVFKSIQNVICICQKTGEILSGSVRGNLRSKKGSTKGSKNNIEAGSYVLISRRGFGTVKYTHGGNTLNIAKADIVQKYSDSQWNELKINPDFVNIQNCKTSQDDNSYEFEDDDGNFDFDDI